MWLFLVIESWVTLAAHLMPLWFLSINEDQKGSSSMMRFLLSRWRGRVAVQYRKKDWGHLKEQMQFGGAVWSLIIKLRLSLFSFYLELSCSWAQSLNNSIKERKQKSNTIQSTVLQCFQFNGSCENLKRIILDNESFHLSDCWWRAAVCHFCS